MSRSFVLLSTYQYPLLGHLLEALARAGARPSALILDSRELSAGDATRLAERTEGALPWRPLHEHAAGVPVYFVDSHNDRVTLDLVRELQPDFIVNGGTPRILKTPLLEAAPLGVINCHPGRLPDYRGCSCPEWAVFNDDPVCNTTHRMTAGIDEGPVVAIEAVAIPRPCSHAQMRVAVYRHGFGLLARVARDLQNGTLGEESFAAQGPGTYRQPIDDERMRAVVQKLERGEYVPAASP